MITPNPPPSTPLSPTIESHFGRVVNDPYRWLEDGDSDAVKEWSLAQTARATTYLSALPAWNPLRKRISTLLEQGSLGLPVFRGKRVFWTEREGLEDHAKVYWKEGVETEVLLDPNGWSDDGTRSLDWWVVNREGTLVVYGVSEAGSEMSTTYVLEVETGKQLEEEIPYTRWANPSWLKDNRGFYYSRYPQPGTVPPEEVSYHRRVYLHILGTDWEDDPLVFGADREKEEWPSASVDYSGKWLLVEASKGWDESTLFLANLTDDLPHFSLVAGGDGLYSAFIEEGFIWILERSARFPLSQLWRAPLEDNPADRSNWQVAVPQSDSPLQSASFVGGKIVLAYEKKATSKIVLLDPLTLQQDGFPLPGIGSVGGLSARREGGLFAYSFASFDTPPVIFQQEAGSLERSVWGRIDYPIDPSGLQVQQVEYPSQDGTLVTMFLVHKEGVVLDGSNPTLLTGYGGFNISQKPYFSPTLFPFLEAGGVFALPNLRGGGEYGEGWHQGGMLKNKQNSFDDFISAAEWLISHHYTSPQRLAISGGSNGGLLVGAAMTQRPDLFKAVVCAVPLLDMVRYDQFLIARLWIPEYGDPSVEDDFHSLYSYSPYHHIPTQGSFPSLLLMTANHDSRVDPLHARKFAALAQRNHPNSLILLRVEDDAGHGVGKPISFVIDEVTDRWAFLFDQWGLSL